MALAIAFGHFFYVTRVRGDRNTGEDGSEHGCVPFKHSRVFATTQGGSQGLCA